MVELNLTTLDLSIIIGYLIFVVLLGFYFSTKHKMLSTTFLLECLMIGSKIELQNKKHN